MISRLVAKGSPFRNVIMLITGTSLAQAIPVAISPILTRLYSPDEFGTFATYLALVSILSIIATGRYELAIMVPKRDREAASVLGVSFGISSVVSILLFFIILVLNDKLSRLLNFDPDSSILYWVPLSVGLTAAYQSLNYWCNRKGYYRVMSSTRVAQSASMSGVHLGAGFVKLGSSGLITGAISGQLFAFVLLLKHINKRDRAIFTNLDKVRVLVAMRKYINFPKYLVVAHSFNMASFQSPVMLLGTMFDSSVAGFFMLTQRVIGAPMSIVASAIGDVFRQQASHEYMSNGNCEGIYRATFIRLLCIAVVPFVMFFIFAPDFFSLVFGAEWRVSGEYARILTPMLFFQFITSPMSSLFFIANKQKVDLLWQSALFATVCGSLFLGAYLGGVKLALCFFSAGYSLMYIINGLITFRFAKGNRSI